MKDGYSDQDGTAKRWLAPVLLCSISYFWLENVVSRAAGDLAVADMVAVGALTTVVLLVETVLLVLARRAQPLLLPSFALLNTYSLYIVFDGQSIFQDWYIQLLKYAGIFSLYFFGFKFIRSHALASRLAAFGAPLAVAIFILSTAGPGILDRLNILNISPAKADFKTVQFKEKPNVYFLSFDALTSEAAARKFIGLDKPPYIDVLRDQHAFMIKNTFSDAVATRFALSSVLELKANLDRRPSRVITGKEESPLRKIFEANGYQTHFTMYYAYFGPEKGRYLTHYDIYRPYSACDFIGGLTRQLGFFGICWMYDAGWLGKQKMPSISYDDFSLSLIKAVSEDKTGAPHFYMEHVLVPGHTDSAFRGTEDQKKNFREHYLQTSTLAANAMRRVLQQIRSADPKGLIFVYGDHGAFVSQGVNPKKNLSFIVPDRYGTVGAIINGERCERYVEPPNGEKFQTIARIAVGLVRCLAGGESPAISNIDYGAIKQLEESGITTRFDQHLFE